MNTSALKKEEPGTSRFTLEVVPSPASEPRAPAAEEHAAPVSRQKAGAVDKKAFESFLVISVLFLTAVLIYESITQASLRHISLLSLAHAFGYLKSIPVEFKPSSGLWLLFGWTGTGMMVLMMAYTLRKRGGLLGRLGSMRIWLNGHMFLGVMGPVLIVFHTTFKFNGIIGTSFWCMVVTAIFGVLGRYIYLQIPRSMTGAELKEKDIERLITGLEAEIELRSKGLKAGAFLSEITSPEKAQSIGPVKALLYMMWNDTANRLKVRRIKRELKRDYGLSPRVMAALGALLSRKSALIRKRNFLSTSQKLLHYWHVLHIPLAIVMFLIMFVHIAVYYMFRPV
ncbi:MAG: hypothetical protein A2X93_05385 [Deltaproteobacteria bacterium GWC2_56_8]|nr:MAG: hypothetical protein A2X99_05200 [Deltaproteobacteria bacterium GWB2_55_19]OGP34067.1 MAG: hypothetical protein A2X93_05385 [Deltaproteobacteria bacterium GWC2_56_8]HAO92687.1 hypothetical protein [Deltaproteobacteria bacterium]